ncbi:unnamed protein product, partial [Rotaria sp. Silwood1]
LPINYKRSILCAPNLKTIQRRCCATIIDNGFLTFLAVVNCAASLRNNSPPDAAYNCSRVTVDDTSTPLIFIIISHNKYKSHVFFN